MRWTWSRIIRLLVALLIVVLAVLCVTHTWNSVLPSWAHCRWCEPAPVAVPTTVIPPQKTVAVAPAPAVDTSGKDCVRQQMLLLGSARTDAIAKAKALYGRTADGESFVAYVTRHQDGDWRKGGLTGVNTLGKYIEWNFTAKNGAKFHLDDTRHVCICHDWHFAFTPPPPPPPSRSILPSPARPRCFAYHTDGRGGNNEVTGKLTIEFYRHGGSYEDAGKAMGSGCMYAVDEETGRKIYLTPDCDGCDGMSQEIWPLDVVVDTKATLIVKFMCPSKHCTVYLPAFWAAETSTLWCFAAVVPYMSPDGDGWTQYDYFDRVTVTSVQSDIPRGAYHRVIRPAGVIGDSPDQQIGLSR